MSISRDEVCHIASLARLRLAPEEEAEHAAQLSRIIRWVDQLGDFEGSDGDVVRDLPSVERDDIPRLDSSMSDPDTDAITQEEFLGNAPAALDTLLLVPQVKVVGDD